MEFNLKYLFCRLWGLPAAHGEDRPRGDVRIPALLVPLSGRQLQVAGVSGAGDVTPDAGAQVHHHLAGRRHRLSRHRHQPARSGRLGHDAKLFRPSLHVSFILLEFPSLHIKLF